MDNATFEPMFENDDQNAAFDAGGSCGAKLLLPSRAAALADTYSTREKAAFLAGYYCIMTIILGRRKSESRSDAS